MQQKPWEGIPRRKRAIIYCRVSTDKQEQDGESLDYQEEKCRQYADLHDLDVILVLREAKSGYIHYSLRDQLTLARQMIRDGLADMIIVWDLRRFSRNFVHSAMIFEETESVSAEIISVSENIDNSLTGKLIRSILAWSAESEREKLVEYANRHWQARLASNLPMGSGRAPYGWQWGDVEKTFYMVNKEEAAIRISIFEMFVELDMSLRAIAHKLTEDGIAKPAMARGIPVKHTGWNASTLHALLTDEVNIGILTICKNTIAQTPEGGKKKLPNANIKKIEGGIPAIVDMDMFERAQTKLKTNKSDKSHPHRNPEDFLLKGHMICKACGHRMAGRYNSFSEDGKIHSYAVYACTNHRNKYDACPEQSTIRTNRIDEMVWEDCCRVFERLDVIRDAIASNIQQSIENLLEDTAGKRLIAQAQEEIAFAKEERAKHAEGSYTYRLISQDIVEKEDTLRKYEKEYKESGDVVQLANTYQKSILGFLDFLNTMHGRYENATFKEKRNALAILGVKVFIAPREPNTCTVTVDSEQEWFSIPEAADATPVSLASIRRYIQSGHIRTEERGVAAVGVLRDELKRYLGIKRPDMDLDAYPDEWFSLNKILRITTIGYNTINRSIRLGELETHTIEKLQTFIHRDELNRFLHENPVRPKTTIENIRARMEVTYTPIFTGVQTFSTCWHAWERSFSSLSW